MQRRRLRVETEGVKFCAQAIDAGWKPGDIARHDQHGKGCRLPRLELLWTRRAADVDAGVDRKHCPVELLKEPGDVKQGFEIVCLRACVRDPALVADVAQTDAEIGI